MNLQVEESFPGELEQMTPLQKAIRVQEGANRLAAALGVPRGGEMQLIVDLSAELGTLYDARAQRFASDYARLVLEAEDATE